MELKANNNGNKSKCCVNIVIATVLATTTTTNWCFWIFGIRRGLNRFGGQMRKNQRRTRKRKQLSTVVCRSDKPTTCPRRGDRRDCGPFATAAARLRVSLGYWRTLGADTNVLETQGGPPGVQNRSSRLQPACASPLGNGEPTNPKSECDRRNKILDCDYRHRPRLKPVAPVYANPIWSCRITVITVTPAGRNVAVHRHQ
jgi:hypothetical protein